MSDTYYPPGGFYFTVSVLGTGTALAVASGVDASFQEVSGIEAKFNTEDVTEGGENRFVHRLPKPASYSNLVLKRGIVSVTSFLVEWVGQTVGSGLSLPIVPQNILVTLLGAGEHSAHRVGLRERVAHTLADRPPQCVRQQGSDRDDGAFVQLFRPDQSRQPRFGGDQARPIDVKADVTRRGCAADRLFVLDDVR